MRGDVLPALRTALLALVSRLLNLDKDQETLATPSKIVTVGYILFNRHEVWRQHLTSDDPSSAVSFQKGAVKLIVHSSTSSIRSCFLSFETRSVFVIDGKKSCLRGRRLAKVVAQFLLSPGYTAPSTAK